AALAAVVLSAARPRRRSASLVRSVAEYLGRAGVILRPARLLRAFLLRYTLSLSSAFPGEICVRFS
ncbi:MAG: hypothetical protein ABJP82_22615, partial [Hyphomicrobiales bacterium]